MKIWKQLDDRHVRHLLLFVVIMAPAIYIAPIPALILLACGVADVGRHRRISIALIEQYFTGKGLLTWLLSPINLAADLLAYRNQSTIALDALPPAHRRDIEDCVAAFIDNGELIRTHIERKLKSERRAMLTFKWFGAAQDTEIRIPAFERNYRYIKTIAISTFTAREQTSWHFGPQRLTFRVLRNLDPVESRDVLIAVDDRVHYWSDQPLFIFDDTMFHRSINNVDGIRFCLFMDIIRPNRFQPVFDLAIRAMSVLAGLFKRLFYKNWAFMR